MRQLKQAFWTFAAALLLPSVARAQDSLPLVGPTDRALGLQPAMTEISEFGHRMHNIYLLPIITVICLFVLGLLLWVIFRYRASRNPVASKTSHNTLIEVLWTAIPVLILVFIAVPSFRLLYAQYTPPEADLTIKAIGHQWYWEYEYPDAGGLLFDSIMLPEDQALAQGEPPLLAVDNRVVVPAGKVVKMLVTSVDVMHSWAIPSFFVKMDAVPGRINETWFKVDEPGIYYGQCSELCGIRHGFMPIAVEVLPQAQYDAWLAAKLDEAGIVLEEEAPVETAALEPSTAQN